LRAVTIMMCQPAACAQFIIGFTFKGLRPPKETQPCPPPLAPAALHTAEEEAPLPPPRPAPPPSHQPRLYRRSLSRSRLPLRRCRLVYRATTTGTFYSGCLSRRHSPFRPAAASTNSTRAAWPAGSASSADITPSAGALASSASAAIRVPVDAASPTDAGSSTVAASESPAAASHPAGAAPSAGAA
jgi:hypothetical protein